MKRLLILLIVAAIVTVTSVTTFAQQNKKAAAARKEIKKGKKDLKEAKLDSVAGYKEFKKEAEVKIARNEKEIAALKEKHLQEDKAINEKYDQKVGELEKRNHDLDIKIKNADVTKISLWTAFKNEVNRDLDALQKAIQDVDVDKK